MTASEFIEAIKTIPQAREKYAEIGLTEQEYKDIITEYDVRPKRRPQRLDIEPMDELIALVMTYDLTKIPMGLLFFDAAVSWDDDFLQVGTLAATSVCLCRYTGEVLIVPEHDINEDYEGEYDPDIPFNSRYRCAVNGEVFLDALIYAATFLEKDYTNPGVIYNERIVNVVAEHCTMLAGGHEYGAFWEAFLRFEFI